jgi:hypothetical protein
MFQKSPTDIWVVNEEDIFRFETDFKDTVNLTLRLPFNQLMVDEGALTAGGDLVRGNHKSLLIVPDHWMGNQSFPFRSNKPSLIEPFLARKLSSGHPGKENIVNFFDYRLYKNRQKENDLYACFMQDEKGFALYELLEKHHMAPLRITTPAYIWESWLKRQAGIKEESFCFLHFWEHECSLYFYHLGNYLFSRRVPLTNNSECWPALTYEINQSLYLFAQKTKSEFKHIYWFAADIMQEPPALELPERELIELDANLTEAGLKLNISELIFLDGMLSGRLVNAKTDVMSLTHRRVKKHLEWRLVQRLGLALGVALAALMMAENLWLGKWIEEERFKTKHFVGAVDSSGEASLQGYSQALDALMMEAARLSPGNLIVKLASALPPNVLIRGLDIHADNVPRLKLSATVEALDVNHFKETLNELVRKLNETLKPSRSLSIRDIDFQLEDTEAAQGRRYLINFRIQSV